MQNLTRTDIIHLSVDAGLGRAKIDAALTAKGFAPLTEDEALQFGLVLPANVTAASILGDAAPAPVEPVTAKVKPSKIKKTTKPAKEAPVAKKPAEPINPLGGLPALPALPDGEYTADGILQAGPIVGKDSDGAPVHALLVSMAKLCGNVSNLLKTVDPAAHETYHEIKAPGTREAKARAYVWAFARLMQLGYLTSAIGAKPAE